MKKILLKSLIIVLGLFIGTLTSFSQDDVFEKMYQEQLAKFKLGHALKAETNKQVLEIGVEGGCQGVVVEQAKNMMEVGLPATDLLVIRAKGYPSSGYRWLLTSEKNSPIELVAQKGEPAKGAGVEEYECFVLKSRAKGEIVLRFEYKRTWMEEAPLKEYEIRVTSKGAYTGSFTFKDEPEKIVTPEMTKEDIEIAKALPANFDWRTQGGVTSVKSQGSSSACWAFGACGSFESVIKINTGATRDLSEQWLCNCNSYGFSCTGGGWFPQAMFKNYGAVYESQLPFSGNNGYCGSYSYNEKISGWGYTDGVSDNPSPSYSHYASNTQIKQAIYNYGPVAANCYCSCWTSTTGIFYGNCTSGGHIITLVGWNDSQGYWIVKNSWGDWWADGGYLKLAYNTCSMGKYSVWVDMGGTPPPTCDMPTGLYTNNLTSSSARLNWGAVSSAQSYAVAYRKDGTTTWSNATASSNYYNLSGLSANTNYEWGVQTNCSGGSSDWTSTYTFKTTGGGTDDGGPLSNGVAGNGSMSSSDGSDMWYIDVGANAASMRVVLTCGSADFDTYGRFNSQPTTSTYDWRGYTSGGEDNTVSNPQQGRHYIMVDYYSGSGSYSLTATITYGSTTCNTPSGLYSNNLTSSSARLNWGAVSGAQSYTIAYRKAGTSSWTNKTTSSNYYNLSGLSADTNYEWGVQTTCSGGTSDYTSSYTFKTTGGTTSYCTASGSAGPEYISRVQMGSINRSSSRTTYSNYTSNATTVYRGNSYNISVNIGSIYSGDKVTAWVDWNNDGDFSDSNEKYSLSVSGSTASGSITVPTSAVSASTRMRVRLFYSTASNEPCGAKSYGEVEDYTINVASGLPGDGLTNSIKVAPNPADDILYVTLPEADATIRIIGMSGKVVYNGITNSSINTIDVSNIPAGTYNLNITSGKNVVNKLIIIK